MTRWRHTEREKSHDEYIAQAMLLGMDYFEWLHAFVTVDGKHLQADTMEPLTSEDVVRAIDSTLHAGREDTGKE